MSNKNETLKELNKLFGSYRAEWLKDNIFNLFAAPYYFAELQGVRPCVLQGGRGTGKTTLLRGLSYQGQYAFHSNDIQLFDEVDFIGIYHRVNTNHVRAFVGEELNEVQWQRVFAHYFNIMVCKEILCFVKWHSEKTNTDQELSEFSCRLIAKSINIEQACINIDSLLEALDLCMYEFQSSVNNIGDNYSSLKLSMSGDPIVIVTEHVLSLKQFKGKVFYILLDEYENFTDYQQKMVNTLIKHSTDSYTFKIGVRELGWRIKHTLNSDELLYDPADYVLINIEEKLTEGNNSYFSEFARNVCQQRISQLFTDDQAVEYNIVKALGELSIEDEAILLDVRNHDYYKKYKSLPQKLQDLTSNLSPLFCFFITLWGEIHNEGLEDNVEKYIQNPKQWKTRYDNYSYETLFKIRKGKVGIQKYYSGWNTYVKLANGNIRYLMQLIYLAYEKHLNSNEDLFQQVSPKNQTLAAQEVGKKNLMELEGLWRDGSKLTKLLLSFGRIFNVLASEEIKSAPEQNQFAFDKEISKESKEILDAAVMHLALVRIPGNKFSSYSESKEYMYTLHPIYSPYFVFSYRKKRKISINDEDFQGIIKEPKYFIKSILQKNNVSSISYSELPSQLSLFEDFYND